MPNPWLNPQLRRALTRNEYVVNEHEVAAAMMARGDVGGSAVLVAPQLFEHLASRTDQQRAAPRDHLA